MIRLDVTKPLRDYDLEVCLEIGQRETLALVGPTGCGKTTVLRILAGLERPEQGVVMIDGTHVVDVGSGTWVTPQQRRVGMVFQDYALFPHLSVLRNVEFGARARSLPRGQARKAALEALAAVGLDQLADVRATELSGGQQQRVSLARALASGPRALLLDEPMSALDASTRREVRAELRRFLEGISCPAIVVTHDVVDALTLGDRVCVMHEGKVVQVGDRADLLSRPRSPFVAEFLGVNLISGEAATTGEGTEVTCGDLKLLSADAAQGPVQVTFSPWDVVLSHTRPEGSARNVLRATVSGITHMGGRSRIALNGGVSIVAEITYGAHEELGLGLGDEVYAAIKAAAIHVY